MLTNILSKIHVGTDHLYVTTNIIVQVINHEASVNFHGYVSQNTRTECHVEQKSDTIHEVALAALHNACC